MLQRWSQQNDIRIDHHTASWTDHRTSSESSTMVGGPPVALQSSNNAALIAARDDNASARCVRTILNNAIDRLCKMQIARPVQRCSKTAHTEKTELSGWNITNSSLYMFTYSCPLARTERLSGIGLYRLSSNFCGQVVYLYVKSVRGTRWSVRSTSAQNRPFTAIRQNSVTRTRPPASSPANNTL